MEIEVNRVYRADFKETDDIIKKKKIYYNSIDSVEQSDMGYTEITLAWGEKILINEEYDKLNVRLEKIKKQLEDDAKRKDILGE